MHRCVSKCKVCAEAQRVRGQGKNPKSESKPKIESKPLEKFHNAAQPVGKAQHSCKNYIKLVQIQNVLVPFQ